MTKAIAAAIAAAVLSFGASVARARLWSTPKE
jgi:hypothetical protein